MHAHVFNFLICGIGTLSYEKKKNRLQCNVWREKVKLCLNFGNPLLIVSREANGNKENI